MTREQRGTILFIGFVVAYLVAGALADAIEEGRWQRFRAVFDAPTVDSDDIAWVDIR